MKNGRSSSWKETFWLVAVTIVRRQTISCMFTGVRQHLGECENRILKRNIWMSLDSKLIGHASGISDHYTTSPSGRTIEEARDSGGDCSVYTSNGAHLCYIFAVCVVHIQGVTSGTNLAERDGTFPII